MSKTISMDYSEYIRELEDAKTEARRAMAMVIFKDVTAFLKTDKTVDDAWGIWDEDCNTWKPLKEFLHSQGITQQCFQEFFEQNR